MRYPNLRYGNPTELNYYALGLPLAGVTRAGRLELRRAVRATSGPVDPISETISPEAPRPIQHGRPQRPRPRDASPKANARYVRAFFTSSCA